MSSRNPRGECPQIPQDQLPDYERASKRLREANFDAAQLVITLAYIAPHPGLAEYACRKLRAVVVVMKMALQTCEQISSGDWGPRNVRIEYILTPPCDCQGKMRPAVSHQREDEDTPAPVKDPTWGTEVEALLLITQTAALGLANSVHLSAEAARRPLACLMALYKVVVRQQQHVAVMGSSTHVEFIVSERCIYCGRIPSCCRPGGSTAE